MSKNNKKPKQRLYMVMASAKKEINEETQVQSVGAVTLASSSIEAASKIAKSFALRCKSADGWFDHEADASEVDPVTVRQIIKAYR